MKKLKVNVVSETLYVFKGEGVHSAFMNTLALLRQCEEVELHVNSLIPCDILHAHDAGPIYLSLMPLYRGRRVLTAHVVPEALSSFTFASRWGHLASRYIVRTCNMADIVLAVSLSVRRTLEEIGVRAPQRVVPDFIDASRFRPDPALRRQGRNLLGLGERQRVVLSVGVMTPHKGVADFMRAAEANRDLTFVWVGGHPFSLLTADSRQMRLLVAHGPSNVLFAGEMPPCRMPAVYNAADCLLFPSLHETFGIAVVEAAACGLPLVLRDLPHYRETFGGGYLAACTGEGFAACVHRVFSEQELAPRLKGESLSLASRFAAHSVSATLMGIYREVYLRHRREAAAGRYREE